VMILDFESLAGISAARAVNSIAEGVALAFLCWIVLRTFAAASSIVRFVAWFTTLLAVAGLPFLVAGSAPASIGQKAQLTLSSTCATALFSAWGLVAGLLLVRLGVSLWHVRRLERESREIGSDPRWTGLLDRFVSGRRLRLCVSDKVRVPTALGFFQPSIVLPAWALREFTPEELETVVLHEVAHLRRWDDWTNLVQKLVKAIFFFHPAVWWIDGRLALEREMACDEAVLRETGNPRAYARSLVAVAEKSFAEKMRLARALSLAQSALGRIGQISLRLTEILKSNRRPGKDSAWRPALALIASLTAIAFIAMPYAPRLIAFEKRSASLTASPPPTQAPLVASILPAVSTAGTSFPARAAALRPAGARSSLVRTPRAVLEKAATRPENSARMLIVVERAQMETAGRRWTLCVWRIASRGTAQANVEETIIVNSI
jgi:beta-lactamase regulating signal transducer with metallopeptidase domain